MNKPLTGKTALITGASRGIGRSIALELASLGVSHIVLNYARNEEAAQKTQSELEALGAKVLPFQANVGDPKALEALVEAGGKNFGAIDLLIHNAALGAFKPVHQLKPNHWDLSMEINAKAFLLLVQKALPWMEKSGASVVALSSLGSKKFIPNYGAIGISKSALETTVRYLAVELASKKIRVNCVSGGLVDTDAIKFFPNYEIMRKEVEKRTPAGRIAKPEDLAKVVAFLCLPESGWIYGQTLVADGGLSLI